MYGIAQASTAYLVTKITDPPPPPEQSEGFAQSQVAWKNKHDFLRLSLDKLDTYNTDPDDIQVDADLRPTTGKKFT